MPKNGKIDYISASLANNSGDWALSALNSHRKNVKPAVSDIKLLGGRPNRERLIKRILSSQDLPVSGKKEELINRIIKAEVKPNVALEALTGDELYNLCKSLPGIQVSGSKPKRISNIIRHFDKLRIVEKEESGDRRLMLYEYYVELATRDRGNLLSNNIISKDKYMDNAFEEATRYFFEKKLGILLEETPGNEHADGVARFPKSKELFMWDTKSKETVYEFPNDHFNQFRRDIHNSTERVNCFMVIAPEISDPV